MSFLSNFFVTKATEVHESVLSAIVTMDPDSASQADLMTMEQDLDKAGQVIVQLQEERGREQAEVDRQQTQYNQYMSAAELMQKQISDTTTPADKVASLTDSLSKLLTKIEQVAPQLARDKKTLESTQALLQESEAAYKKKSADLLAARSNLLNAKNDLAHANLEKERADERAKQASVIAGINTPTSKLTTALDTMTKRTAEVRAQAQVADMKATALRSSGVEEDANITAALNQVSGVSTTPASLADRLAALKQTQ